jgi:hypothetical protein
MNNHVDEYNILFHSRASAIFSSLSRDFKCSTGALDRLNDENVFQGLQAKYTIELKRQLQEVALEVLEQFSAGRDREGFNRILTSSIEEYTNEFLQKARSL